MSVISFICVNHTILQLQDCLHIVYNFSFFDHKPQSASLSIMNATHISANHFLSGIRHTNPRLLCGTCAHHTTSTSTPVIGAFYSLNGLPGSLIVFQCTHIVFKGKLGNGWLIHCICCHENLWTGIGLCGLTLGQQTCVCARVHTI